jgi:hypothetical protein
MPQKGNPNAKKVKSSDYIADLEKQIKQLLRQIKDAKEINAELKPSLNEMWQQEEEFEKSLMEKYPSLFHKNEDGTVKYAECGIGCPKEWQQIVDDLCGSIVSYEKCRYRSELNPKKKIRIFLFKKVWTPIWYKVFNFIYVILDPYKQYRPKDTVGYWTIPREVSKVVEATRRYKFVEWLRRYNYGVLVVKNMYTKKDLPEAKIAQVKTKFGGLRFYLDDGDDNIYGMIHFAEYLCSKIK